MSTKSEDEEKQGKNFIDSFFDAAEAVVGKAEIAFGEKDRLWKIEDIIDDRGTVYRIVASGDDGRMWAETPSFKLAQIICEHLNG